MENIIESKKMILEHVLYEMQMYLYTLNELHNINSSTNQLFINIVLESHLIHMRNLLEFFTNEKKEKTDINYIYIMDNKNDLDMFTYSSQDAKTIVNKAINHLTIDRINKDHVSETRKQIYNMEQEIPKKIEEFIEVLPHNIKSVYKDELKNKKVQNDIENIKYMLYNK